MDEDITRTIDPLLHFAKLRVGTVLRHKWRLDVLLGLGGMGAVYAATHITANSRVAIKILHTSLSLHAEVRTRFQREARIANTIGHPGVVRVIDEDVAEDGAAYLVMDLLDGESLDARAGRHGGVLSVDEVLSAADQLLDVLIAAHAAGVVHRDLKPENISLTRAGEIKVLDFGIARLKQLSTSSNATRAGSTLGTPAFMSPEQARGIWEEVDSRADIWAAGATMFALLTGRPVHEGRSVNETLVAAITSRAPALKTILPDVPEPVAALVDKALAYERDARWSDAASMQHALRRAYEAIHRSPITSAPRLTVPPSVPNRTLPMPEELSPVLSGGRPATTARPVAAGITGAALLRTLSQYRTPIAIAGAAGAVLVLFVLAVVIGAATRGGEPTIEPAGAATPVPTASPTPSPATAVSAPSAAIPEPGVEPSALASSAPPKPPRAVRVPPTQPQPPATKPPPATTPKCVWVGLERKCK